MSEIAPDHIINDKTQRSICGREGANCDHYRAADSNCSRNPNPLFLIETLGIKRKCCQAIKNGLPGIVSVEIIDGEPAGIFQPKKY